MATTAKQRGAETRQRLLAAAAELVPEVGWGAVTTRTVAERAGVNPALVHYHFASMADLLIAAVRELTAGLITGPLSLLRTAPDPLTGLCGLLDMLRGYTGTDPASVLLFEAYLAAARSAELRAELIKVLGSFRDELAGWLHGHGVADAESVAAAFAAMLDGMMLHRILDPRISVDDYQPALRKLLG